MRSPMKSAARLFMVATVLVLTPTPLLAQGLESKQAIDAIVGSTVEEEQIPAAASMDRVIAAMDRTAEVTEAIRKATRLEKVEIVHIADAGSTGTALPPAVDAKMREKKTQLAQMRKELEGNAMLFHAIDARNILLADVVAVSFDSGQVATIYTTARPAG